MTIERFVVVVIFAVAPWGDVSESLARRPSEVRRRVTNSGDAQGQIFR